MLTRKSDCTRYSGCLLYTSYGIGYEGCDYNEMNDIWTPQLRAIDGINPRDPSLAIARKAGVTCVCTGPGLSLIHI